MIKSFNSALNALRSRIYFVVSCLGPNSIAKCVVEPEVDGRHRIRYIPVEVGTYSVTVKWNGREIEGKQFDC
jgi:hypothetical protein